MTSDPNRTAVLLLTHVADRPTVRHLARLFAQCSPRHDVFFVCDNTVGTFDRHAGERSYFLFRSPQLVDLGYPGKSAPERLRGSRGADPHHGRFHFSPGNVELPVLLFFRSHPDYAHYWTIEYDVRFTGSWDAFLSPFDGNDADLLGTTLTRREEIPTWDNWPSLDVSGRSIDRDQHLRGFFPVYRLSRRALAQLERDYRVGVRGHFECLIPTLLNHAGMTIEDIGGDGEFVRPGNTNRFYRNTPLHGPLTPGTFVFRPVMRRAGRERNMLWHPVKPRPLFSFRSRAR